MPGKMEGTALEGFTKTFGRGIQYRTYSESDAARLEKRLPDVMQEILKRDGWSSYKDQVLWMTDPDDWVVAARAWFADVPGAQVFLRTAFGDLIVWDGTVFWYVMVHESVALKSGDNADWFFARTLPSKGLAPSSYLPKLVKSAKKTAGPLEWDEMYTYVPALALGGSEETSRVEPVKAREALVMLASLAPIRRRG
jgi:hypothetical protein